VVAALVMQVAALRGCQRGVAEDFGFPAQQDGLRVLFGCLPVSRALRGSRSGGIRLYRVSGLFRGPLADEVLLQCRELELSKRPPVRSIRQ